MTIIMDIVEKCPSFEPKLILILISIWCLNFVRFFVFNLMNIEHDDT